MPVLLKITKQSDTQWLYERQFNQETITIGRGSSNDLILEDLKRIIGRQHAMLKYEDEKYFLWDRDSRNGTFLNEKRIGAQQPFVLHTDDRIRIGEYIIEFKLVESEIKGDETIIIENPFLKEVQNLVNALSQIQFKYSPEVSGLDASALREAVQKVLERVNIGDAGEIVAEVLLHRVEKEQHAQTNSLSTPFPPEAAGMTRLQVVLILLLEAVVSLAKNAWNFRVEFLEMTFPEHKYALHNLSIPEVKAHLFNPATSDKEFQKRLNNLKLQIDQGLLHPLALIDGYRTSIKEGVQELFAYLDPLEIEKEFSGKFLKLGPLKISYRFIPFYVELNTYYAIKRRLRELLAEDRGTFDRKIFRPSFSRAYLKTVSSRWHEASRSES